MKKVLFFVLVSGIVTNSLCQEIKPSQPLDREAYLKKSKNQKTAAWVLLGGGVVLIGTGLLIGDREESSFDDAATGAIIGGIGAVCAVVSIPLFIASGKNKRKGMSLSFKNEKLHLPGKGNFVARSVPSVAFSIYL